MFEIIQADKRKYSASSGFTHFPPPLNLCNYSVIKHSTWLYISYNLHIFYYTRVRIIII